MHIQGWGTAGTVITGTKYIVQSGARKKNKTESPPADTSGLLQDDTRTELLSKIKKRINSGFYNSEAVIEDLGHGFAQALDQTL
jgi:hypothetical protein